MENQKPLSNKELFTIRDFLKSLSKKKMNAGFSLGISRNINLLSTEINTIEDSLRKIENKDYDTYLKERESILSDYAGKDDKGKALIVRGQYIMPQEKSIEAGEKIQKLLTEKYPDVKIEIEEINKFNKEIFDKEATKLSFYKIKSEAFDKNIEGLTVDECELLRFILEE